MYPSETGFGFFFVCYGGCSFSCCFARCPSGFIYFCRVLVCFRHVVVVLYFSVSLLLFSVCVSVSPVHNFVWGGVFMCPSL